jgi:serine/threonine protein kinase
VYRCVEVATGRELAVKVIITHELSAAEIEAIKREVRTIKKLHHENLVTYYKATEKKAKHLSIYMEYVAGGSLSARLRHGGALPLATTRKYTRQLCEALRNLHENGIAHRDVKCANVFLTSSTESIKLGDFGAFKEVGSVSLVGGLKGTPHWMAPEIIRAEQQTSEDGWFKADIWSLGCTVIEMLTGHSPWQQYSNPLTAMYQIVSSNKTPTIPADATEEVN